MKEKEKESLFLPASICGLQAKSYTFQHWRHHFNAVVIVRNNKNKCISFVRLPSALTAVLPSCWPEQLGYCFGSPLALLLFFFPVLSGSVVQNCTDALHVTSKRNLYRLRPSLAEFPLICARKILEMCR